MLAHSSGWGQLRGIFAGRGPSETSTSLPACGLAVASGLPPTILPAASGAPARSPLGVLCTGPRAGSHLSSASALSPSLSDECEEAYELLCSSRDSSLSESESWPVGWTGGMGAQAWLGLPAKNRAEPPGPWTSGGTWVPADPGTVTWEQMPQGCTFFRDLEGRGTGGRRQEALAHGPHKMHGLPGDDLWEHIPWGFLVLLGTKDESGSLWPPRPGPEDTLSFWPPSSLERVERVGSAPLLKGAHDRHPVSPSTSCLGHTATQVLEGSCQQELNEHGKGIASCHWGLPSRLGRG